MLRFDPSRYRDALSRLEQDGIVRCEHGRYGTTRRWQGAMARAAYRLQAQRGADAGADAEIDLRVPIAHALVDVYGADHAGEQLAGFVEALLFIEAGAVAPSGAREGL